VAHLVWHRVRETYLSEVAETEEPELTTPVLLQKLRQLQELTLSFSTLLPSAGAEEGDEAGREQMEVLAVLVVVALETLDQPCRQTLWVGLEPQARAMTAVKD
jgi:hypothetical protein